MTVLQRKAPLGLVIFDCDGVLADSEPIDNEVVSSLLKELGHDIEPDEVGMKCSGLTDEAMWSMFEDELGRPMPTDIKERWERTIIARFREQLLPMPGIVEIVRRLEDEYILYSVASNGSLGRIESILNITGLTEYFGGRLFSATEVANAKPGPDLFLLASVRLAVSPKECVVIEDSRPGVQAGLAAGMTVLGFCPNGDLWNLKGLGIRTFGEMDLLPELLGLDQTPVDV